MGQLIAVIPTIGTCDLLPRTLRSLSECELPPNYGHTVIVENGPPGDALAAVEQAPSQLSARYLHVERANKSNALNLVFESFQDDDLIYLADDDVRFSTNVLTDFAAAARDKSAGYVFGGPLRIDSNEEPPAKYLEFLPGSMKGWEPTTDAFNPSRDLFLGANWAVFAGDIKRAGGFDPRFGPGSPMNATGQEWGMQRALRRQGAVFQYLPKAIVWHHVDFSRFSPEFLLRRKFRGGLEAGILSADRYLHPGKFSDRYRFPATRARFRLFKHGTMAQLLRWNSQPTARLKHELLREHAKGFLKSFYACVRTEG